MNILDMHRFSVTSPVLFATAFLVVGCVGGRSGGGGFAPNPVGTVTDTAGSSDVQYGTDAGSTDGDAGTTTAADGGAAQTGDDASTAGTDAGSGADTAISMADVPPPQVKQTDTPKIDAMFVPCPTDGVAKTAKSGSATSTYAVKPQGDGSLQLHGAFKLVWPGSLNVEGCAKDNKLVGKLTYTYSTGKDYAIIHYNAAGELHGPSKWWHSNGKVSQERMYDGGKDVGWFYEWSYQGNKTADGWSDSNGKLQGLFKTFYGDGKPDTVGYYLDDKLHGPYIRRWATGPLRYTGAYKSGKAVGLHRQYSYSGKIAGSTVYKDGTGSMSAKFDNGKPWFTREFKNSKIHGKQVGFHSNGQKAWEGAYTDGTGAGTWWYDNGKKQYEAQFKDGQYDGEYRAWNKDGTKAYEGPMAAGQRHGTWTYFKNDVKTQVICWIRSRPVLATSCDWGMLQ